MSNRAFSFVWLVPAILFCFLPEASAQTTIVGVTAQAQSSPAKVILSWKATGSSSAVFTVQRREVGVSAWSDLGTAAGTALIYEDATVTAGKIYEYQVTQGSLSGFTSSGVDVPFNDAPGTAILIVDQTIAAACATKLDRFKNDLIGDGWKVIRHDVARGSGTPYQGAPTNPKDAVPIKNLIVADAAADPKCKAVILFGRIPIPYSGWANPDGHYSRAMPTDGYYSDLNETWTDNTLNQCCVPRGNEPGDGIFDNQTINSRELMVGRIDMAALTQFAKSETELLNQYLDKDHNFRVGNLVSNRRCLILPNTNQCGFNNYANVYRTGVGYFGYDSTTVAAATDFDFSLLTSGPVYSLAFRGCAGSAFLEGPGTPGDIPGKDYKALFFWTGASYYMQYDYDDAVLRELIATPTYTVGSLFSAGWASCNVEFSEFSMGVPFGMAAINPSPQANKIFFSPMGDPTLRMYMIKPPSGLTVAGSPTNAVLSWTASPSAGVLGYNVYRAGSMDGDFSKLNSSIITATTYTDNTSRPANAVYMVRAVSKEDRGTGLYYNASQGIFQTVGGTTGTLHAGSVRDITIKTADGRITMDAGAADRGMSIVTLRGQRVFEHKNRSSMNVSALPAGVYLLSAGNDGRVYRQKICVNH